MALRSAIEKERQRPEQERWAVHEIGFNLVPGLPPTNHILHFCLKVNIVDLPQIIFFARVYHRLHMNKDRI